MLVAIADVALVLATAGAFAVLFTVAAALIVAGAFFGFRSVQRRALVQQQSPLRRRA